jgi:hypothetical protein
MKPATLDKLMWTLIYGGLFALALGLSVQRRDATLGWSIAAAGGLVAVAVVVLVFVRARLHDPSS